MSLVAGVRGLRRRLYFRWFGADSELRHDLSPTERVLDVGCSDGRGSELLSGAVGCDIYLPALHAARASGRRTPVVNADIRRLPFRSNAFDVVASLDVIEHFEKDDALGVIAELERVAAGVVALMTPSGFVPQPPAENEPWQEHRCGFESQELRALGYDVVGVGGDRRTRSDYAAFRLGPLGMLAALATRASTRRKPEHSYHLYARKVV